MIDNNVDEVISNDGIKATYREVISNRFDSTAFKKDFADIYLNKNKLSNGYYICAIIFKNTLVKCGYT